MEFATEALQKLAKTLREDHGLATTSEVDRGIADIVRKMGGNQARSGAPAFPFSKLIRGSMAMSGAAVLNETTREEDVAFVRTLIPGSTPGSYLIPIIQADQIIPMLTTGGILRAMGPRIWDMTGIQILNVPLATLAPAFIWMSPGSQQTPSDPNLGQMTFNLKTERCMVALPNEMLKASVPSLDLLITQLIALAAAESEDQAFFSTTTLTGAPTALYAAAGTTRMLVAGNANGGNISYTDLISILAQAAKVKAKPPFCWAMSPRTFYTRILGMVDTSSRPLVVPTLTTGLADPIRYTLFGWPVFISPFFDETQTNGSGTNQSWLAFCNASYLHIGQGTALEIMTSMERYFDFNQVAIRCIRMEDFNVAPPQGVIIMQGIN